jgi:hypothetical protein
MDNIPNQIDRVHAGEGVIPANVPPEHLTRFRGIFAALVDIAVAIDRAAEYVQAYCATSERVRVQEDFTTFSNYCTEGYYRHCTHENGGDFCARDVCPRLIENAE